MSSTREPDQESASWWLRLARGDLSAALALHGTLDIPPRAAAGLAQQAAEKAIKGAIAFAGDDPPRTHDLVALWQQMEGRYGHLPELPRLADLSGAARGGRYPDPAADPYERVEVERLITIATEVLRTVETLLERRGLDLSSIAPA